MHTPTVPSLHQYTESNTYPNPSFIHVLSWTWKSGHTSSGPSALVMRPWTSGTHMYLCSAERWSYRINMCTARSVLFALRAPAPGNQLNFHVCYSTCRHRDQQTQTKFHKNAFDEISHWPDVTDGGFRLKNRPTVVVMLVVISFSSHLLLTTARPRLGTDVDRQKMSCVAENASCPARSLIRKCWPRLSVKLDIWMPRVRFESFDVPLFPSSLNVLISVDFPTSCSPLTRTTRVLASTWPSE